MDLVPMLIQQGYRAIAVTFDVWGLAGLVANSIKQGREFAKDFAGTATP